MSLSADCRRMLTSVSAYLDGDLAAADCDEIENHCQQCPRCANVVAGLRETVNLCRQAASIPLPDAVQQRARASVRRLLASERTGQAD
jgi:anti-sigma factor RsiW